jgi:hypothetical protein
MIYEILNGETVVNTIVADPQFLSRCQRGLSHATHSRTGFP